MPSITEQLFTPPQTVPGQVQPNNPDLMYALSEVFSIKNIEMKTDLNQRQINAITRGKLYAKEFKSKLMADLVRQMMVLMISKNRKGRAEFTQMAQSVHQANTTQGNGIAKQLLGL